MVKQLFIFLFLICGLNSFSQKLIYNSNGNILNSENQKIFPDQVRELLVNNEQLLADYNAGRSKKTAGNILLWGGFGMVIGYLGRGFYFGDYEISSPANIIGIAAIVIAIPVKIGFSKKIENVVTEYNNQKATGNANFNKQKFDLITNSNGIGFRLTLN
jgi:hypothetical protein